ncbi:MAG: peptidylprolyl isomerase [Chloroflexota bacterium]|nr:peptidylprolyl isomerase [Chloroflexota bacterium]MDE3193411.1 peptidylprolyl isomerase [Chloroflexota bacterium]
MARWQRERRQQAIVITVFTAVLVFVIGLAAWAAANRYYESNVAAAAQIQGLDIPKREYQQQLKLDLVQLYFQYGVPLGQENDPQLASAKAQFEDGAIAHVVEQHVLDLAAHQAGITVTPQQIDAQYQIDYGEFKVRHILVQVDPKATDPAAADAAAKQKAEGIAKQLQAAPNDQDLWNKLAKDSSDDPGSKDAGGELGYASHGQYVPEFENAALALKVGQVSDPVRSQYGYHVIQLEDKKEASQTDLFKKYQSYGFGPGDLRAQARYDVLRDDFGKREKAELEKSPQEQVHVAMITVNIPPPTGSDPTAFTTALKKQDTVKKALESGADFATVAKANSDDASKDSGGDIGWVTRGMMTDPQTESVVFGAEAGKVTDAISTGSSWTIYKVLEKSPSRALDEDQKIKIEQDAYTYWLERQKKAYDVQNVLPGAYAGQ